MWPDRGGNPHHGPPMNRSGPTHVNMCVDLAILKPTGTYIDHGEWSNDLVLPFYREVGYFVNPSSLGCLGCGRRPHWAADEPIRIHTVVRVCANLSILEPHGGSNPKSSSQQGLQSSNPWPQQQQQHQQQRFRRNNPPRHHHH